jgi:polysaccharide deacetylase 2 family uncharacterized protein YibQ
VQGPTGKTAKKHKPPVSKTRKSGGKKRKAKTGIPYFRQAVLLTAGIIIASFVISLAAISIIKENNALPEVTEANPDLQEPAPGRLVSETALSGNADPAPRSALSREATIPVEATIPKEAAVPPEQPVLQERRSPQKTATVAETVIPKESLPREATLPPESAVALAALPPEPPPKPARQTLVFVIDDAGNSLQDLEPFLSFPGPLTIAVLPGLPNSAEAARRIRAAGKEVFLHQPMEAVGGEDPGPGAIYSRMDTGEILEVLEKNVAEIGPVAGINNHQGSKITSDERIMETVLAFCREKGLPFLDSRTISTSVVPAIAKRMDITIGERNIFIDNDPSRTSMEAYIDEGLRIASGRGSAVLIGHVRPTPLAGLLADLYPSFIEQGYTFATAGSLIRASGF